MLNKEAYNKTGLIYGIGHAVYTISDPRAILLKELARDLAREKGKEREFAFLELLEERAIDVFGRVKNNGKTVSSNVDWAAAGNLHAFVCHGTYCRLVCTSQ